MPETPPNSQPPSGATTFVALLQRHAKERPNAPALREKEYGIWQSLGWADLLTMVERIACGLHQAGLKRGEHLVVIGSNRPRLYAMMLGAQAIGAIPIPLYQDAAGAVAFCGPRGTEASRASEIQYADKHISHLGVIYND